MAVYISTLQNLYFCNGKNLENGECNRLHFWNHLFVKEYDLKSVVEGMSLVFLITDIYIRNFVDGQAIN